MELPKCYVEPLRQGYRALVLVLAKTIFCEAVMTRLADEAFEAIYSNIENGLLRARVAPTRPRSPEGAD